MGLPSVSFQKVSLVIVANVDWSGSNPEAAVCSSVFASATSASVAASSSETSAAVVRASAKGVQESVVYSVGTRVS